MYTAPMMKRRQRKKIDLPQLMDMFPTEDAAKEWFEGTLWAKERCCGTCGSVNTHETPNRKPMPYRCRDCRKYFSVKTGLPWLAATSPFASGPSLSTWS